MHARSFLRPVRFLTVISPILMLMGCFGDGDGKARIPATPIPPVVGILVDSPVTGAEWQTTAGETGVTNDLGEFSYVPGENVTFSVGGIVLGTAPGAPIISAVELTGSNNPTDKAAVNQFVFLQSIDEDQDPTNGIQISSSTRAAAAGQSLDFNDPDFRTAVTAVVAAIAPGNGVVSDIDALAHFYTTFADLGGTDVFSFSFPGFPPTRSGVTYELVFADEFDTGTAPDSEKWNYDLGYGPDNFGWGNDEWQLYTDSPDNIRVEEGNLVIQARCDTPPCGVRDDSITSARITTKDKFEFRYGTVIARIKPPVGEAAWPAFWSLGSVFPDTSWPRAGEIDFMEIHNFFSNEGTTHFTMHWCDETVNPNLQPNEVCFGEENGWIFDSQFLNFRDPAEPNFISEDYSLGDDFHLFEADWDQNRIIGRIDGIKYFEREIDPATMEEFLREFFMILNVAMGGTLGSNRQPPSGNEVFPQTMLVDYVRVFQRTDAPTPELFIDFEEGNFLFNNFEGGVASVIDNPVADDNNSSAQVGQMQKFAADSGQTFGGSTLVTAFDVPPRSAFKMKVWSEREVDVLFQLEPFVNPFVNVEVRHPGTGWEELTFDFGDFTGTATGITLIFDNGDLGDAGGDPDNWTFYFDDIQRVVVLDQIDLPITFDEPFVDYTLTDFGDPPAMTTLVADPEDANNTVASTTKPAGAPVGAGTTMSTPAGLASPIPFMADDTTIGVRVYSPAAGIPVRLKADDRVGEDAISVEAEVLTTVADEWETLVFDFSNPVPGSDPIDPETSYQALSIFFNFGTEGDGATYLWDDVEFGVPLPDTTPPTLTSVTIASDNPGSLALATTGDTVTVDFSADEALRVSPSVTIGGTAATVNGGGADWEASRTVTEADADGVITFSIEFADVAGNAGAAVSATTDESSVTVDATAPTLMIMGAPATFTTLDPIALTFQFSEPVTGFSLSDITRTGGSAAGFVAVDGDTYTANLTPNGTADLTVAVMAGVATDTAGNANEAVAAVTITNDLDADAPLLTVNTIFSNNANPAFARTGDLVTVEMTVNEDILEPNVMIAGAPATVTGAGTDWQASRTMLESDTEGSVSFTIEYEDLLNNAGPTVTGTTAADDSEVTFDVTAPALSIDVPDPIRRDDRPVAVTFQFTEDVTGFTVDDIGVTNGSADGFASDNAATYTAMITADAAGPLTVSVDADAAADLAGNGSETQSATVTVDLTPFYDEAWSDGFSGTMLNAMNWTRRTDADCPVPCDGMQSYREGQVTVGAGRLTITAANEVMRGATILSGLIDTRDKRPLRYGRVEIDVRLPAGTPGVRPSLWLLPATSEYGSWPQAGQIDITDVPGGVSGSMLEHTLRYGLPEDEDTTATAMSAVPAMADANFLTYALEWEAGEIRWFVEGTHVASQISDNWYTYFEDADGVYTLGPGSAPFDEEFYLLIGMVVDSTTGEYPQILQIDQVRVLECANGDPVTGAGCAGDIDPVNPAIDPVQATDPPYNGAPYIEALEVYADAPAMLDFIDQDSMPNPGTLVPDSFGVGVTSVIDQPDGGNTVWRVDINAPAGTGGVFMGPADFGAATASFDLTDGDAAGEVLFRMRVNSATGDNLLLVAGLDSVAGSGSQELTFVADGAWRNYSVKIGELVTNSVMEGTSLDVTNLVNLFRLEASNGTVNLDVDDISVKVACRDVGRCEATPRLSSAPAIVEYSQNFEPPGILFEDPDALANDGYLVFATVFGPDGTTFQYQYGAFPAPNIAGPAFSSVTTGQGGVDQGAQQLSIYNDYNNTDHTNGSGNRIEASVFRQRNVTADDLGKTITFSFDAKLGNIEAASTANAFIKTLNPMTGFNLTNCLLVNTTSIPTSWQRYEISLPVASDDTGLVGQLIQFGFANTASNGEGSGIFYDNLVVEIGSGDVQGENCLP